MRIIDVRKINKGFAVYVNTEYDIKTLEKDKRFQELTTYYKNHKLLGKEFYFTFPKETVCSKVLARIKKLLGPAQKEVKEPKKVKDVFDDLPSESFLNRGINKEHRKRQPKIIKEAFKVTRKRGRK